MVTDAEPEAVPAYVRSHMPILVINLDRARDRLSFVDEALRGLGLDYQRIAASDGQALPEADCQAFAAARPRDGKRGWRAGQIGCFLSHEKAWRIIAQGLANWTLVLEDDLHISRGLPALLQQANALPSDADVVRLEATGQWLRLRRPATHIDGRGVRRVRTAAWGAGAYLITRAAAARLIACDPAMHSPVDDFLFNPATSLIARSLVTYQIVPALISQDKFDVDRHAAQGFGSDIETDQINGRLSRLARWRRAVTSTLRGKSPVPIR